MPIYQKHLHIRELVEYGSKAEVNDDLYLHPDWLVKDIWLSRNNEGHRTFVVLWLKPRGQKHKAMVV